MTSLIVGEVVQVTEIDEHGNKYSWFGTLLHIPSDVGDWFYVEPVEKNWKKGTMGLNPVSPRLFSIFQAHEEDET